MTQQTQDGLSVERLTKAPNLKLWISEKNKIRCLKKGVGDMSTPVVSGASCLCTMGTSTGQINPTNQMNIRVGGQPVASISDSVPISNITPFGMCTSLANPMVAAATAAALGVLTPQPCIPSPAGTWICAGKVRVGGKPILTTDGKIMCAYGGNISIMNPGQTTVHT